MQKLALLLPALALALTLSAQQTTKKYVLIEHFTNSNCSVCASKNPAFYNLIGNFSEDVHHIAYHPPIPYTGCVFYQANTVENNARTSVYNISSSPRVALNGVLVPLSAQLLPPSTLAAAIDAQSPLKVEVNETNSPATHSVNITLTALSNIPAGNYRVYVAAVEKTINQTTPNGESVHHDVFRKMLPDTDGLPFTAMSTGESQTINVDYPILSGWNSAEMYAVVFVQEVSTKAVLNSGTRFDNASSAVGEVKAQSLRLSPNPAQAQTVATLSGDRAVAVDLFGSDGSRLVSTFSVDQENVVIPTASLAPGVYFVKIRGEKGVYVGKMVKE